MRTTIVSRGSTRLTAILAAAALVASLVAFGSVSTPLVHGRVTPAVGAAPHHVRAAKGADALFGCQGGQLDDPGGFVCYSPQQIQAAYGFSSLLGRGMTGKGRTIVIIDAYSNPWVKSDLALFDQTFGLPDPVFKQVAPDGVPKFDFDDPEQVGWAGEITLDVQWAHAMAPGAKITLVLAKSSDDADILSATRYAIDHNLGDVISQSFGEADSCVDPRLMAREHALFARATAMGITLFAASGDDGAAQPTCDGSSLLKAASSPASDPLVTGVGATNLQAGLDGAYGSERAWADQYSGCFPASDVGCSGGGLSSVFDRPDFQDSVRGVVGRHRGVPDVAYNGGVDGGVLVHDGVDLYVEYGLDPTTPDGFFVFGGTSAGTPQWAGLTAIADQAAHQRLGSINDSLYEIGTSRVAGRLAFHDIRDGTNTFAFEAPDDSVVTLRGYDARRGWDAVTGLGSPKADVLVPLLAFGH